MKRWLGPALAVGAVALAAWLLHRTFGRYSLDEITASVRAVPAMRLAGAAGFAAASYVCLTGFDYLALRCARRPLPYRKAALASFCALSLGHNIGLAALSSGAVRYRFYAAWGLAAEDIAKVVLYCAATVALGLLTLGGLALLAQPGLAERITGLGRPAALMLGAACLAAPVAYVGAARHWRRPLRLGRWSLDPPPLRLALAQVALGAANFACVAACLHQALAATADVGYPSVAAVYVIANVSSIVSHVPGGLGVVESVVLVLLGDRGLIGGLVVFRVVYYLVPLLVGASIFLAVEATRRLRSPRRSARRGCPAA